jgi:DNA repair exonuclease SbcCD nuclease subunit
MKNFYTAKELQKISDEDLLKLTSFDGAGETYFYSDIQIIQEFSGQEDGEFCFKLGNGEEIFTKNAELINDIKVGKARYDLLSKSLETINEEKEANANFREEIRQTIRDEMGYVHQEIQTNRTNFDLGIQSNGKKINEALTSMEVMIEKSAKSWDNKMDTLKKVDTKKFDTMMKQMETLTVAFSQLLED